MPAAAAPFSHDELIRYSRHLILPHVGADGQARLKAARILLIGAGGLGSPAALYLAAAGVGTLGIIDGDRVDLTNLQRQILHGTSTLDVPKVESARARLGDLNPDVRIVTYEERLTSANAPRILRDYDVVIDGSDNFPTRYLVNDACVLGGKPYVYGAIFRFEGQVSVFAAAGGPCYRCLFRDPPPPELVPSCADAGVLGVLPGIIGSLQALEAIKLVLRSGETLVGRLLLFDGLKTEFREVALHRDAACPACGDQPTIHELIDYEAFCGLDGQARRVIPEVSVAELARERSIKADLMLLDVREPGEWEICRIDGATLIPLGDLPARLGTLDSHRPIVAYCHTGRRSARAVELLRAAGFADVRNLRGGIDAWALEVEPGMVRY
jgi:adenylyltransferase/sulfurtransferase